MTGRLAQWRGVIRRVRATYARQLGRKLRLWPLRRYNEKMQWRKLFDLDPRYAILSDKLAVRDFIAARMGDHLLTPLLWHGEHPDDIPFDDLTPPYVVKSSHGCGHTVIVGKGDIPDRDAIRALAQQWLATCYGTRLDEPGYINVPHRLMIERCVTADDGAPALERKLMVFGGKVALIRTARIDNNHAVGGGFYTLAWDELAWSVGAIPRDAPLPRPALLDEMIAVATRLGAGFEHVRVDMYDCGSRFWLGEITIYSWSGLQAFSPDEADFQLGAYWHIRRPLMRALTTVLTRPWAIAPPPR